MRLIQAETPLSVDLTNKTWLFGIVRKLSSCQKSKRTETSVTPKDKSSFLSFLIILTRQLLSLFPSGIESLIIDLNYSADPECVYLVIAFDCKVKTCSHLHLSLSRSCRPGTEKVRQAQGCKHLHVVNPDWLWSCLERWERVEEQLYPLKEDYSRTPR